MPSLARFALPIAGVLALAPVLSGCPNKPGCTKDTDCKGARVCVDGECVADSTPASAPTQVKGLLPTAGTATPLTPISPTPPPTPAPAATPTSPPDTLAADGLPVEIPPPGSPVPTTAEWNAVQREIVVRGSTRLKCETKMLREWLRVDCHKNFKGEPIEARHTERMGQQAFQFVGNHIASIVVQVIRGKRYGAQFIWDNNGAHTGAELIVSWTGGMPRPQITLTEN